MNGGEFHDVCTAGKSENWDFFANEKRLRFAQLFYTILS